MQKAFDIDSVGNSLKVLSVLSSSLQRHLIQIIRKDGPVSAYQVGKLLGRKKRSVHYYLNELSDCGLISLSQKDKTTFYSVDDKACLKLQDTFEKLVIV